MGAGWLCSFLRDSGDVSDLLGSDYVDVVRLPKRRHSPASARRRAAQRPAVQIAVSLTMLLSENAVSVSCPPTTVVFRVAPESFVPYYVPDEASARTHIHALEWSISHASPNAETINGCHPKTT